MTAPSLPQPGAVLTAQSIDDLISDMSTWRSAVSTELLALDDQVRLSALASATADLGLAFLLWRALAARLDEIIAARGKSGINRDVAANVSALVWAPMVDVADGLLAQHLPEGRTVFDALLSKLRTAIGANSARIAENARLLGPISDRVSAARTMAAQLGNMTNQVALIAAQLEPLGPTDDPATIRAAVAAIDAELRPIEYDLLTLAQSQSTLSGDIESLQRRLVAAGAAEQATRALALRCTEKIADAPRLGIPSVAVLGAVPVIDTHADWRSTRALVDAFGGALERVERALTIAQQTYRAPLDRRGDLRGLLDGYRSMAAGAGLGERADAAGAYDAAHRALWSAPCELAAAAALVDRYQQIITAATHPRPGPAVHPTAVDSKEDAT